MYIGYTFQNYLVTIAKAELPCAPLGDAFIIFIYLQQNTSLRWRKETTIKKNDITRNNIQVQLKFIPFPEKENQQ